MRKLATFLILVFLYVVYSRIPEAVHAPGAVFVLATVAFIGAVLGGDLGGAIGSKVGLLLIAFTGWACVTLPFSTWPGGSLSTLRDVWFKSAMVFYLLGAVLLTARECTRGFYALAAGTATTVLLSFRYANMDSGRLAFGHGTLGNPNDFATYLLVGAPFCVFALLRAGVFMRIAWMGVIALLLMQFVRTGSRAGLVAVAIVSIYVFWKSPVVWKLAITMCLIGAVAAAPVMLPKTVLERYGTLLGAAPDAGDTSRQAEFAENSAEGRSQLLRKSIEITITNPLMGVGIGQFNVAVADLLKTEGQRSVYLQTHNMYTQVSSETGFPGLFLYMAAIVFALGNVRFVRRHAPAVNQDLAKMAMCLQCSWIVLLSAAMFASVAYHMQICILFGLSYVLKHALIQQMATVRIPVPAAPKRFIPRAAFAAVQPALR
jgi:O-antigen ligase